jgi:hypothetical protein
MSGQHTPTDPLREMPMVSMFVIEAPPNSVMP